MGGKGGKACLWEMTKSLGSGQMRTRRFVFFTSEATKKKKEEERRKRKRRDARAERGTGMPDRGQYSRGLRGEILHKNKKTNQTYFRGGAEQRNIPFLKLRPIFG